MKPTTMTFSGTQLKAAREALEYSIPDFHRELILAGSDLGLTSLYAYEDGLQTPSANVLPFLARVLRKPMEYFFQGE